MQIPSANLLALTCTPQRGYALKAKRVRHLVHHLVHHLLVHALVNFLVYCQVQARHLATSSGSKFNSVFEGEASFDLDRSNSCFSGISPGIFSLPT